MYTLEKQQWYRKDDFWGAASQTIFNNCPENPENLAFALWSNFPTTLTFINAKINTQTELKMQIPDYTYGKKTDTHNVNTMHTNF